MKSCVPPWSCSYHSMQLFHIFFNGSDFTFSSKYGQSFCQTALPFLWTSLHMLRNHRTQSRSPLRPAHGCFYRGIPKDSAAAECSTVQVSCRWDFVFKPTCKGPFPVMEKYSITNYVFVFPEDVVYWMDFCSHHTMASQFWWRLQERMEVNSLVESNEMFIRKKKVPIFWLLKSSQFLLKEQMLHCSSVINTVCSVCTKWNLIAFLSGTDCLCLLK